MFLRRKMETHVRDVSIKLQKRVINLHIIPYFMGRCVIWIDITNMNVNLQMGMVKILTHWILDLSSYETVTANSILDLSSYETVTADSILDLSSYETVTADSILDLSSYEL